MTNTYRLIRASDSYTLTSNQRLLKQISGVVPKNFLWISFEYSGEGKATRYKLQLTGEFEVDLDVLMVDGYLVSILNEGINEILAIGKAYDIPTLVPHRISLLEEIYKVGHIVVPSTGVEDFNLNLVGYYKKKRK